MTDPNVLAEELSGLVTSTVISVEERALALALYGELLANGERLPERARSIRHWRFSEELLGQLCECALCWRSSAYPARLIRFRDAVLLLLARSDAALLEVNAWRSFVRVIDSFDEEVARDDCDSASILDEQSAQTDESRASPVAEQVKDTALDLVLRDVLRAAKPPEAWTRDLVASGVGIAALPRVLQNNPLLAESLRASFSAQLRSGGAVSLAVAAALRSASGAAPVVLEIRPRSLWAAETLAQQRRSVSLGRLYPTMVDARCVVTLSGFELRLIAARSLITEARLGDISLRCASAVGPRANETWVLEGQWPSEPIELTVTAGAQRFSTLISFWYEGE